MHPGYLNLEEVISEEEAESQKLSNSSGQNPAEGCVCVCVFEIGSYVAQIGFELLM